MALTIECHTCEEELDETGSLFFSVPFEDDMCYKFHFCRKCTTKILCCVLELQIENGVK